MAITGNIKTFYLSSLLQLLSNDKKTGILELTDGSDIVQVFFRDGTIINAFGSSRVERLTNYLRSEGIVSREQLDKCLAVSAHTGKKIGKVLVEQGLISQDLLESLLYRQIEQTLFSLFLWEQGEFEYRDQELDLSDQIVTSFDTMQVVLEASRRVDEISQLKQRVPQDNEVLEITANSEALQKATLNTAERAILSLINGKRTVKRVIADSGYDELKAYKILFSLVTAGLVIKEKNILKRPADGMQQEIPGRKRAVAASGSQAAALVAEPVQQPESPRSAPHTTPAPPDKNVPAADLPGQTAGDLFAAPAAQHIEQTPAALFAAHETTQPQQAQQQPESRELVLELEPRTKTDDLAGGKEVPAAEVPLLSDEEAPAGQTVIKIDGQYLAGADLPDPETPQRSKLQPVGKSEVAAALRTYSADSSLDDYDTELAQARRRLVKRAIAYAAGVIIIVAAGFFLKSFMLPDEPAHVPAVDVPRVAKKKPPKKPCRKSGSLQRRLRLCPSDPRQSPMRLPTSFGTGKDGFQSTCRRAIPSASSRLRTEQLSLSAMEPILRCRLR